MSTKPLASRRVAQGVLGIAALVGFASCSAGPRIVALGEIPESERYAHARAATELLFPDLELQDASSGWIVSLPRYVGGVDRRRLRAYVHVFAATREGARAEIWVEREVFASKWLFGLLGSEGWVVDGRDDDFEERLYRRMTPDRDD
ncbi:MAG: hypothetical protein IPN34_25630 [Planctomycetes bacterium]|nr:hypothetical protein [Planctomycetota bacterium]